MQFFKHLKNLSFFVLTMPSILDRDYPRPIIIPGNPWPFYIIIAISIILVLGFMIFLVYLWKTSPKAKSSILSCAPGQCITNIYTGVKTCPGSTKDILDINVETETCNSPFTCESSVTPYALLSDGSTNLFGICDKDVQCRCLARPQCANHVTSYFNVNNGSAFQGIESQAIVFNQEISYKDRENVFFAQPPLRFVQPLNQFCEISEFWIGEQGCKSNLGPDGCNRTWPKVEVNKPCLRGVLAYVPTDSDNFTRDQKLDTPLSCVIGDTCPDDQLPYWDKATGKVACLI